MNAATFFAHTIGSVEGSSSGEERPETPLSRSCKVTIFFIMGPYNTTDIITIHQYHVIILPRSLYCTVLAKKSKREADRV